MNRTLRNCSLKNSSLLYRSLPSLGNLGIVSGFDATCPRLSPRKRTFKRYYVNGDCKKPGNRLVKTEVLVQNGIKISELPHIVEKKVSIIDDEEILTSSSITDDATQENSLLLKSSIDRCLDVKSLLKLLEMSSDEEIDPTVAIQALNKLIDLDNTSDENIQTKSSFLHQALINILLNRVYESKNPEIIMESLRIATKDTHKTDVQENYKTRMVEETLLTVSKGHFSLNQIIEAIKILSNIYPDNKSKSFEETDKFWSGILDKVEEIDESNIKDVFKVLSHLKKSRLTVFRLLEKKLNDCWMKLSNESVLEILQVLCELNTKANTLHHHPTLEILSQWLLINNHKVSETQWIDLIRYFGKFQYSNRTFMKSLEKLIRFKGIKIENTNLIASICDYVLIHRKRSDIILNGIEEYIIHHKDSLTASNFYSMVRIFGELNFHPKSFKIWSCFETVLIKHLDKLSTNDLLRLLLSFIYLERYPLNFVPEVHIRKMGIPIESKDQNYIEETQNLYKLFDISMKMGCKSYKNAYVQEPDSLHSLCKYMTKNSFLLALSTALYNPLSEIVGSPNRIKKDVVIPQLPLMDIYVVEMMIYPTLAEKYLKFNSKKNPNIAVVVHPREHYDKSGKYLIGIQAMRIRHLKQLGYKVMELRTDYLNLKYNRNATIEYLRNCYEDILKES